MPAFYDMETPLSSLSPRQSSRLSRGLGDVRRKILVLTLLVCLTVMALTVFRRQDYIRAMLADQRHGPTTKYASTDSSTYAPEEGSEGKSKKKTKQKHLAKGPVLGNGQRSLSLSNLADIRNRTLGFENVYVLNVPSRTDKLDAMTLTASLTDFDFDVIKGVTGSQVSAKALSSEFPPSEGYDGIIGCWRGHMNFALTIVKQRLASALILEDDADWDVSFRSQLELFALGSQALLDSPQYPAPTSPYGDGWDLLWLGHCAVKPADNDNRRFIIKNDPTLILPEYRMDYLPYPNMSVYDKSTRIMFYSKISTCTYAYALSYRGAEKILKYLSMDIYGKPVDFGLTDMCTEKERGFKCISVFPEIVSVHRAAGIFSKDSDINPILNGSNVREKGFTVNILRSTRLNVDLLIDGEVDKAESQWPEDTPVLEEDITTEMRNSPVKDNPDWP